MLAVFIINKKQLLMLIVAFLNHFIVESHPLIYTKSGEGQMALDSAKKQEIISKFARQEKDTGSTPVRSTRRGREIVAD